MLTKKQTYTLIGIWSWAVLSILIYAFIYLFEIQYDSSGSSGLLWWLGQIFFIPSLIVSEAMYAVGISIEYEHQYVFIIISISIFFSFAILFHVFNKDFDDFK